MRNKIKPGSEPDSEPGGTLDLFPKQTSRGDIIREGFCLVLTAVMFVWRLPRAIVEFEAYGGIPYPVETHISQIGPLSRVLIAAGLIAPWLALAWFDRGRAIILRRLYLYAAMGILIVWVVGRSYSINIP